MDSEGRVVVSTQTINGYFGNSVVVDGTGVVMNNEMDDLQQSWSIKFIRGDWW